MGAARAVGAPFKFRAAGVTFVDGYPQNLLALRDPADRAWQQGECLTAVLVRNPANPHDSNAIEIHVPSVGMVGHMPKHLAAKGAPAMDAGIRFAAEVVGVAFDDQHPDKPGIEIRVWRAEDDADRRDIADVPRAATDPTVMANLLGARQ